jgi:anaerobic magnesium-protoporphyrin IX monomethyl ester cyclase
MKIILLSPPIFPPKEPYLAVPTLTAFLLNRGFKDVIERDINLESFDILLSSKYLLDCHQSNIEELSRLRGAIVPEDGSLKKYRLLKTAVRFAPYIIKKIDRAREYLKAGNIHKRGNVFNLQKLLSFEILNAGFAVINARYFPAYISFSGFKNSYSLDSAPGILKAAADIKENLFIELFKKYICPGIIKENPQLLGISINDVDQVVPGLTLARLLHEAGLYVVIGGLVFTKYLPVSREYFQLCDSFVIGEGENALLCLLSRIKGSQDFLGVPNLVWYDKINKKVVVNERQELNARQAPLTPAYERLPAKAYFSFFDNSVRFPLLAGSGCYWNKCAFCDISGDTDYAVRDISLIISDIIKIICRDKVTRFFFVICSLEPGFVRDLSNAILAHGLKIEWEGYARFEKEFTADLCGLMKRSGCRRLFMGFESGSQRLLDLMNKGVAVSCMEDVISHLYAAGIAVNLFTLSGFPGESDEDVLATIEFLIRNRKGLDLKGFYFDNGQFRLNRNCKAFEHPENYGNAPVVRHIPKDGFGNMGNLAFDSGLWLGEPAGDLLCRTVEREYYHYRSSRILWQAGRTANILRNLAGVTGRLLFHRAGFKIIRYLRGFAAK